MAHNDLATVLKSQGRLDEAIGSFRAAIRADPAYAKAHANLGMALLARGDFAEGWREYEWRWDAGGGFAARRELSQPQWRGEAGEGRTLLLWAEQGFGMRSSSAATRRRPASGAFAWCWRFSPNWSG